MLFGSCSRFRMSAQKEKDGKGILQPQMTVETGSYDKPAGKLGQKPAAPWSSTTVGASVDGKAECRQGSDVGRRDRRFLLLSADRQTRGEASLLRPEVLHPGQPVGLLTKDGSLYMLMEEEHDPRRDGQTNFRKAAIEHAGHIMEVTGTQSEHAGYKALYVNGFMKK